MVDLFKKLEILEIENKYFALFKSPLAIEQRPRTDKIFMCNISNFEKNPDMQVLSRVLRALSYIPFELNAKLSSEMQLQITETYEISYFDRDHQFIRTRQDNNFSKEDDTGVKLTAFYIINKDDKPDKDYGTISLETDDGKKTQDFHLRNNSIIFIKSRLVRYKITSKNQKVFVFIMKIAGPRTPNFRTTIYITILSFCHILINFVYI